MKLLAKSRLPFDKCIDGKYSPEESIVLRYRNAFEFGTTAKEDSDCKVWLQKTSIREGARIFPLLRYRGVDIYILDETSLMFTRTLKSIDGCVSIAMCKLRGYDHVVFESGGNTGTALTEYGQRAGLETFFFCPEENLSLLNSKTFDPDHAHLISVERPGMVKEAVKRFEKMNGLKHIPETEWRYNASVFRGFFVLEHMMGCGRFDWLVQTVSAAFGPIGIYRVLQEFRGEIGEAPRLLGVQQAVNCPLYKSWKSNRASLEPTEIDSTSHLLTRVMYDVKPHTYGTYKDLRKVLVDTQGDLTTIHHTEFSDFLEHEFEGKTVLDLLQDNGIEITVRDGDVLEKAGLIALAGTLKEIDNGLIKEGRNVLCCLTGGMSAANGQAEPEYRINDVDRATKEYSKIVFGR
jgi:threonine synthase